MQPLSFQRQWLKSLKLVTIIVAVIASFVITFGDTLWYVGLVLLSVALFVRFAIAVFPNIKYGEKNDYKIDADSRISQEYVAPNKPLSMFVPNPAKIEVIGLGGGGGNAITRMVREGIQGAEFIAINTDAQALAICEAPTTLQIGKKITKGLGVGGDPNLGRKAAEESLDEIKRLVSGADMVFISAGMGGGTGTGATPIVAKEAKQAGALTIGIVTLPFTFEGIRRRQVAEQGVINLLDNVDTLIIIPNDRLLDLSDKNTGVDTAFSLADDVLRHGVQAITEVITIPGLINLDFADIKAIMKDSGPAWMSIGIGSGRERAINAAKEALVSPLLDVSIENARNVIFNIVGDSSLTLFEVNEAAEVIKRAVHPQANIIFGVAHHPILQNEARITVIATGFMTKSEVDEVSKEAEVTKLLKQFETQEDVNLLNYLTKYQSRKN